VLCFLSCDSARLSDVQQSLYLLGLRFQTRLLPWPPRAPLQLPIADVFAVDALPRDTETVELAGLVMQASEDRPVLAVAEEITDSLAFAALSVEVRGLLAYSDLRQQLPSAMQALFNGGFWVSRNLLLRFLESSLAVARRSRFALARAELSQNESVLLDAVLSRYSDPQIAEKLRLPLEEVHSSIARLLETFNVRRRDDLLLLADQRTLAACVEQASR
jgi:DNA-binding NarL/FixJ family response regulator